MTTRGLDHGQKWSFGVLKNLASWFPKFIPRDRSSVCGVIRPYTMTSETRVYWTHMAAILAVCWRGNLKFIVRYWAWQTEHSDLLQSNYTQIARNSAVTTNTTDSSYLVLKTDCSHKRDGGKTWTTYGV